MLRVVEKVFRNPVAVLSQPCSEGKMEFMMKKTETNPDLKNVRCPTAVNDFLIYANSKLLLTGCN